MKKWYKQAYFDRKIWILENFDKLNLSAQECLLILLIEYGKDTKKKINYDYFLKKMNLAKKDLDKVLASLVSKHYLAINTSEKGISFDTDGIFEFDPSKYEAVENKDLYSIVEEFLNKPLGPSQIQKVNDLVEKYGNNDFINALRKAEAKRVKSLDYVEGILRNENK